MKFLALFVAFALVFCPTSSTPLTTDETLTQNEYKPTKANPIQSYEALNSTSANDKVIVDVTTEGPGADISTQTPGNVNTSPKNTETSVTPANSVSPNLTSSDNAKEFSTTEGPGADISTQTPGNFNTSPKNTETSVTPGYSVSPNLTSSDNAKEFSTTAKPDTSIFNQTHSNHSISTFNQTNVAVHPLTNSTIHPHFNATGVHNSTHKLHGLNETHSFNFPPSNTSRYNVSSQTNNSTNYINLNGTLVNLANSTAHFNSAIFNLTSGNFYNSSKMIGLNGTQASPKYNYLNGTNATLHHFGGFNSTNVTGLHSINGTRFNGTFSNANMTSFHLNGTRFANYSSAHPWNSNHSVYFNHSLPYANHSRPVYFNNNTMNYTWPNSTNIYANHTRSHSMDSTRFTGNFTKASMDKFHSNGSRSDRHDKLNSVDPFEGTLSSMIGEAIRAYLSEIRDIKSTLESKSNALIVSANNGTQPSKPLNHHTVKETTKITEKKRRTQRKGSSEIIDDFESNKFITKLDEWDE